MLLYRLSRCRIMSTDTDAGRFAAELTEHDHHHIEKGQE
jgi:hypothetical protein